MTALRKGSHHVHKHFGYVGGGGTIYPDATEIIPKQLEFKVTVNADPYTLFVRSECKNKLAPEATLTWADYSSLLHLIADQMVR